MKKERKIILILSIIIIILIGIIYTLVSENIIVKSNRMIIKEMTQSESEANLQAQINTLNASHNEYATNVEKYKKAIATAITSQGISTSYTDAQETVVTNIGKIFEEKTKIDDSVAAIADNITAGKQAYVNGNLITGTASQNNTLKFDLASFVHTTPASNAQIIIDTTEYTVLKIGEMTSGGSQTSDRHRLDIVDTITGTTLLNSYAIGGGFIDVENFNSKIANTEIDLTTVDEITITYRVENAGIGGTIGLEFN